MGTTTQGKRIAIFLLVLMAGCVPEIDPFRDRRLPADTRYGIAVTPGPDGIEEAFALAGEITDYEVFIAQWSEYSPAQMRAVVQFCRKHGLTPILSLSPTTLDQGRKELDLPSAAFLDNVSVFDFEIQLVLVGILSVLSKQLHCNLVDL